MQTGEAYPPFFALERQAEDLLRQADDRLRNLRGADADIMRGFRQQAEQLLSRLSTSLHRVLQHDPASAIEIATYVAALVQTTLGIGTMHTATINTAHAVINEGRAATARTGRANSERARVNRDAFDKLRPSKFDGKKAWTEAGKLRKRMEKELGKRAPKVTCYGQRVIYNWLKN